MNVLVVTNMYPGPSRPSWGIFVEEQVDAVRRIRPEWSLDVMLVDGQASRLNYARAMWTVRRRTSHGYDLVHAHYGLTGAVAAMQRRLPFVVTFHGSDVGYRALQTALSKFAARRAARSIVVTEEIGRLLGSGRTEIIPCGVDLSLFRPRARREARRRLGVPDDEHIAIFPGDPANATKNYPLFAEAIERVQAVIGEPIHVIPLTGIERHEVPWHLAAADVMVMTSLSEGSPMAVKEALACDLPVVSVPVGDVITVLTGLDGCAVSAGTPAALSSHVVSVLRSGVRCDGRGRVLQLGLDADTVAARVAQVYERAAASPR